MRTVAANERLASSRSFHICDLGPSSAAERKRQLAFGHSIGGNAIGWSSGIELDRRLLGGGARIIVFRVNTRTKGHSALASNSSIGVGALRE